MLIRSIYRWLIEGRTLLIVIVPLLSIPFLLIYLPDHKYGLSVFRIFGIFFEIFGLATVYRSISKESRRYNQLSYGKFFISWIFAFRTKPQSATASIAGVSANTSIGWATAHGERDLTTIEEKVEHLLNMVSSLNRQLRENKIQINEINLNLSNKIATLEVDAANNILSLEKEFEKKATSDYYSLASGSVLTLLGMLMTNVPDNIYQCLFKFGA